MKSSWPAEICGSTGTSSSSDTQALTILLFSLSSVMDGINEAREDSLSILSKKNSYGCTFPEAVFNAVLNVEMIILSLQDL